MARVPRNPDMEQLRRRERRTQERLRKKEIEDLPSGGNSPVFCVATCSTSEYLGHVASSLNRRLPYDTIVDQSGGFTLWTGETSPYITADSWSSLPDSGPWGVVVPEDGYYRTTVQWSLSGFASLADNNAFMFMSTYVSMGAGGGFKGSAEDSRVYVNATEDTGASWHPSPATGIYELAFSPILPGAAGDPVRVDFSLSAFDAQGGALDNVLDHVRFDLHANTDYRLVIEKIAPWTPTP